MIIDHLGHLWQDLSDKWAMGIDADDIKIPPFKIMQINKDWWGLMGIDLY